MILKLEIELKYDEDIMHGNDPESVDWFLENVLINPCEAEALSLFSGCIGDILGEVKVTQIISSLPNAQAMASPPLTPQDNAQK